MTKNKMGNASNILAGSLFICGKATLVNQLTVLMGAIGEGLNFVEEQCIFEVMCVHFWRRRSTGPLPSGLIVGTSSVPKSNLRW